MRNRRVNKLVLAILVTMRFAPTASWAQWEITSWRTTLPLPVPMPASDAVSYGDHILLFAPPFGAFVGDVDLLSGDVLAWRSTLAIPSYVTVVSAGVAIVGDHVVVPGHPASAVGVLAADGSIAAWQPGPATNTPATGSRAVAVDGDRIYAVGGGAPFVVFTSVETATLAPDGTLGEWETLTPLPFPINDGLAFVHQDRLYVFGGHSSTPGGDLSHGREVHRAAILPDGTLGGWAFAGLLLEPRTNCDYLLFEDTIHVVAGGVHSFMLSSVESALLDDFGSTADHILSAPLPTVLNEHATAVVGRFGYVIGGNDRFFGGGPQSAVYVAELGEQNTAPVADAGPDRIVAAGPSCLAEVRLDGSGSFDPDGDPLTFVWDGTGGPYLGETIEIVLPLGAHTFALAVNDGRGGEDSDEAIVSVVDETPPSVAATASPEWLWPPNHRMVEVMVDASAADACDPSPSCRVTGVSSDEPADATGSGNTAPDWEITGATSVRLRAERTGGGDGRVYPIAVACADSAGNLGTATATVRVPKSQKR
jgi:hypothetical protein